MADYLVGQQLHSKWSTLKQLLKLPFSYKHTWNISSYFLPVGDKHMHLNRSEYGILERVNHLQLLGSEAVDCLMSSKWAKSSYSNEPHFVSRTCAVDYCNKLVINYMSDLSNSCEKCSYAQLSLRAFSFIKKPHFNEVTHMCPCLTQLS